MIQFILWLNMKITFHIGNHIKLTHSHLTMDHGKEGQRANRLLRNGAEGECRDFME